MISASPGASELCWRRQRHATRQRAGAHSARRVVRHRRRVNEDVPGSVLTAPVSAVQAMFATVRARRGPFCPFKTASSAAGGGFDGTERAGTRSDGRNRAVTALTGAVRTGF